MAMTGGTAYLVKSEKTNYGSNSWTTDLYIYVKLISQNVVANTSTIALGMYVYSKYSIAWSDFGTNGTSYIGTATSGSNCFTFTSGQSGSGTKWLVEDKQVTVSHNSNGTLTLPIYWHWGVNSPWGQYTGPSGSYNVTLTTIDRAAPTVTFTVSAITANGFKISASSTATADIWQYSTNGGSSWTQFSTTAGTSASVTLSSLSPNTSYTVKVRARRQYNQVYGTSGSSTVKTLGGAVVNSVSTVTADNARVTITLNVTVYEPSYINSLAIKSGNTTILTVTGLAWTKGTANRSVTLSSAQRTTLLNWMASMKSFTGTFAVSSFSGSTQIGSTSSKTATVLTTATNSAPTISGFTYARVSTDSDEQFTSYEAQVDYYTQYIKRNPEWEFVKVYTDEGISGTNTKHRIGFNEMIADAMSGKIDLIVTKSVSRFARNTVDSLVTIRKLKEKGVEVFFEKENIYTFDGKGELLLTIMSSLAQEESRSISENVTWGQRKRFADGKVSLPYKQFLGYRKGADGFPEVVPEEAVIVRRIYTRFMEGLTPVAIAKELTADGIPTPAGKQRWQTSTVESILKNEKYKGAALLQKCFTVDFLTKKKKVNEGEVPQYYVEHSHEPIITPEEFDKVQTEFERRKRISRQYSGKSIFSSRIICGDCGAFFGSKVWNSTSKYRRVIWQCNNKFKGEHKCETPHLDEETIKTKFVGAFNAILADKDSALENCRLMQSTLTDCSGLDAEIESLLEEIEVVTKLTKRCIAENSQTAQNQEEYAARYNGFVERYEKAKTRVEELRSIKTARQAQADAIGAFMFEVQELDTLSEFDEKLWLTVIDTVTVHTAGRMTFKFQDGTEIDV